MSRQTSSLINFFLGGGGGGGGGSSIEPILPPETRVKMLVKQKSRPDQDIKGHTR